MNWEPVITAWIVFFVITIIEIIGIQTASRIPKSFRVAAQISLIVVNILLCIFTVVAEYFHISLWFAILFALAIYLLAVALFAMFRRKRVV